VIMEVKIMAHCLRSAISNTATLFQENGVLGCSDKILQRNGTMRFVLVQKGTNIYMRKMC